MMAFELSSYAPLITNQMPIHEFDIVQPVEIFGGRTAAHFLRKDPNTLKAILQKEPGKIQIISLFNSFCVWVQKYCKQGDSHIAKLKKTLLEVMGFEMRKPGELSHDFHGRNLFDFFLDSESSGILLVSMLLKYVFNQEYSSNNQKILTMIIHKMLENEIEEYC